MTLCLRVAGLFRVGEAHGARRDHVAALADESEAMRVLVTVDGREEAGDAEHRRSHLTSDAR